MRERCRSQSALCALQLILAFSLQCMCAETPRFWLETRGGSWLLCEIEAPSQPVFRGDTSPRAVVMSDIALITFSPHDDPNLLNDAIVACNDLGSDDFERREHAIERLKKLGDVARGALEAATKSSDRETARQAHALLSVLGDGSGETDSLRTLDGKTVRGTFVADEITVATRWRRFTFPINALKTLERSDKVPAEWTSLKSSEAEICNDDVGAAAPGELFQSLEGLDIATDTKAFSTMLSPNKVPSKTKDGTIVWKAPDNDESLDDVYAPADLWMKALGADAHIQSSTDGAMSLFKTSATRVELNFCASAATNESPHAHAIRGLSKGVHTFQAALPAVDGKVFLRAFDRNDRVIGTLPAKSVWIGFASEVPIARIRLKYSSSDDAEVAAAVFGTPVSFRFGPLMLGPRVSALARPNEACIYLSSGEILTGEIQVRDSTHFSLHPEFLGKGSTPLTIALGDIVRFEAPWKPEQAFVGPPDPRDSRTFFLPQDIVLQTGDRLKAALLLLNEKEALLELGQNVRLTLPRSLLRRVGFRRFTNDEENLNQTPEAAAAEKPGVKLFTRADLTNAASPQINEVADPKHNPAAGLQSVDNAEVVAFDAAQREITLRDKDGDFPFDASGVKSIVFPVAPATGNRKGSWRVTLRSGLSLDAELLELSTEHLVLEIAGGKVQMPIERIDSIQRIEKHNEANH